MSYDKYIVAFSGGKDSTACFLDLLDQGVPKSKIELWHHLVDGENETFMDWPITEDYCRKFAQSFDVPIYFSWKEGGFKREMLRENEYTAPTTLETPDGYKNVGGNRGNRSTRRKFPQVSPDLKVRWCSAYLKIDICAAAIRNQDRFNELKTCILSGERGEESTARSNYALQEPDRSDCRDGKLQRHVDRHRPIRDWDEQQVWDIIERHGVVVHPCYYMGWSRCSCLWCIFGNANQFASANRVDPAGLAELAGYERKFGVTMKRDTDLQSLVKSGTPYKAITQDLVKQSMRKAYTDKIFTDHWTLPAGAYGESAGPS